MKRNTLIIVVLLVLAMVPGIACAQDSVQLESTDLEWGLQVLKGLPACVNMGIDAKHAPDLDLTAPGLSTWAAYVDDMIFGNQDPIYTQLWFNFAYVSYCLRTGATVPAAAVLRTVLEHAHFKQLCLDFKYIYPQC